MGIVFQQLNNQGLLNQLFMVEAEEVEIDNRSMKQTTTPLN
jgi:hypothetical protein